MGKVSSKILLIIGLILLVSVTASAQIFVYKADDAQIEPAGCWNLDASILERRFCVSDNRQSLSNRDTLVRIFFNTSAPAGVSLLDDDQRVYQLESGSHLLLEVLDTFTSFDNRYRWKQVNGVINVSPLNDYSILETRIPEFKIEKALGENVIRQIVKTDEFQAYVKRKGLVDKVPGFEKYGYMYQGSVGKPALSEYVTIDFKNASIREILNEVSRQRDVGTWMYWERNWESTGNTYRQYRLSF
jgi:hypothetical protein